uniref:Uncharacterized protein n=1 Tax=Characiopsis acuta TaxID=2040456 RepID=A0A451FLN6_9STRA|nr:hypothetical protein [Characiopsis acuta]QAA11285.1 hypothetical protein [Characiopsis acuta]
MTNTEIFENSKLSRKFYVSSSLLEEKILRKYIYYKIPLLFNLYENRLIHFEFLKEVFADLLESKEILRFNFQNRIFSIYNTKKNFYLIKNSFFQKAKLILISTLVILLIRSFPYKILLNENKNFFRLYQNKILRILKSPISLTLLLINKLIRKIKIKMYILDKIFKNIFFNFSFHLILKYGQNIIVTKNVSLNSETYKNLFNSYHNLKILNNFKSLFIFWIYLVFSDYLLLNRFLTKFKTNLIHSSN